MTELTEIDWRQISQVARELRDGQVLSDRYYEELSDAMERLNDAVREVIELVNAWNPDV